MKAEKSQVDRVLCGCLTYDDKRLRQITSSSRHAKYANGLLRELAMHMPNREVIDVVRDALERLDAPPSPVKMHMLLDDLAGNLDAARIIKAEHSSLFMRRMRDEMRRLHPDKNITLRHFAIHEYGGDVEKRRAHQHFALYIKCDVPWRDEFIPHLRMYERYVHELETAEETAARGGYRTQSKTPWNFGFCHWEEAEGGESEYFAKYCTKTIELLGQYYGDGWRRELTEDEEADLVRAKQSVRSIRQSKRLGVGLFVERARQTAEQGLPPTTSFQVPDRILENPRTRGFQQMGAQSRTTIIATGDWAFGADGTLQSVKVERRKSTNFLLTGSSGREYIRTYDARFAEVFGADAMIPLGPTCRIKVTQPGGVHLKQLSKQVDFDAVAKLRDRIAAEDERQFIAKRERAIIRAGRRGEPLAANLRFGTVREELFAERRSRKIRLPVVADHVQCFGDGLGPLRDRSPPWTPDLLKAWVDKFRRENRHLWFPGAVALQIWLRFQPALAQFSDDQVADLAGRMDRRMQRPAESRTNIWDGDWYDEAA